MKLSEATLASVKLAMRIDYDLDDSLIGSIKIGRASCRERV